MSRFAAQDERDPRRQPPRASAPRWPWTRRRGRILAVKWGMNPNSSSLGVDVTFLLFGMAAVVLLTPLVSLFLRARAVLAPPGLAVGGGALPADAASVSAMGAEADPSPRERSARRA